MPGVRGGEVLPGGRVALVVSSTFCGMRNNRAGAKWPRRPCERRDKLTETVAIKVAMVEPVTIEAFAFVVAELAVAEPCLVAFELLLAAELLGAFALESLVACVVVADITAAVIALLCLRLLRSRDCDGPG